jgi:hypothetical protein
MTTTTIAPDRKSYRDVADIINKYWSGSSIEERRVIVGIAADLASLFREADDDFSYEKFFGACGLPAAKPETADPGDEAAFMTPREVGAMIRKTETALAQDRHKGTGLPYIKLGNKVLYSRAEVMAHLVAARVDPRETS